MKSDEEKKLLKMADEYEGQDEEEKRIQLIRQAMTDGLSEEEAGIVVDSVLQSILERVSNTNKKGNKFGKGHDPNSAVKHIIDAIQSVRY